MKLERTLSIIKPDGIQRNIIGEIYNRFEKAGLRIVAAKMIHLTQEEAEQFYAVHKERPFFKALVKYMCSSQVMAQVLEGKDAIVRYRKLMGATDPKEANPGTIRSDYGESIDRNTVHGSDSPETAAREIDFFFQVEDMC